MRRDLSEATPLTARGNGEWLPSVGFSHHSFGHSHGLSHVHSHGHSHGTRSIPIDANNISMSYRGQSGRENQNGDTLQHPNDNKDRRNYFSKLRDTFFNIMPVLRGQVRARTSDCTPENSDCSHPQVHQFSHYEDTYNDEPWGCSFGTNEEDGIWLNVHDRVGTIMSSMVWVLILYSGVTVGLLSQHNHLSPTVAKIYFTICALALASHAKTTFTDPGAIPQEAMPVDVYTPQAHAMCSRCQSYKPRGTHHCRICDRCISGMDHHCPWMNNCVGTGNMKHFVLFLCYTWTASAFALTMFGWNYFFCATEDCTFSPVLIQLVRVMTLLCIGTLIFTSSMLTNVTFGVMTGVGTIDRLKMKADATWGLADDEPLELADIFGVGDYWTWAFPFFDPVFDDYDLAMGYSTPQRLLRERA